MLGSSSNAVKYQYIAGSRSAVWPASWLAVQSSQWDMPYETGADKQIEDRIGVGGEGWEEIAVCAGLQWLMQLTTTRLWAGGG